ncbi:MAG: ATP-dependent DNA helicase [Armatimonadota bacterium]
MNQLDLYSSDVLEGLNEAQLKAVSFGEGPLLIIAGAGTGKTSVITKRIAYLISGKKCRTDQILALTFTDKAAQEMEERVDLLVPYGYTDVMISTFHAFGDFLLKEHALEIGLAYDFKVLSKPEQIIFLKENLYKLPLKHYRPGGNPTSYLDAITTLISRAKDEDISCEEYIKYAEKVLDDARRNEDVEKIDEYEKQAESASTYKKYRELMTENGFIDFGDQVGLCLKLFRENPSILKKYREKFKYILVDEFQDTNLAQYKLIKMLAGGEGNLNVVGDDDQSIYKFRGAAISNILNFNNDYPDAEKIVLNTNYRSTQNILDTSYRLICHNNPDRLEVKNNIDKKLVSVKGKGSYIANQSFDTISTEADYVADYIKKGVKGGRKYKDCAILVRSNNDSQAFIQSLNMAGIPYRFSGQGGLYTDSNVQLLISLLRVIKDPNDSISLYNLAVSHLYNLDPVDIKDCSNTAYKRNLPLFKIFRDFEKISDLSSLTEESKKTIKKISEDIEQYVSDSFNISTGKLLYKYVKDKKVLKNLLDKECPGSEEKIYNISKFFEVINNYEKLYPGTRLPQFVEHLDFMIASGDNPSTYQADPDLDYVNILTYHKAKGLEFSVVFMVNLVQGKFPVRNRHDKIEIPLELIKETLPSGDFHIQEERRLFYVGMTRAKDELIFTYSRDLGGKRQRKASQFVLEALDLPKAEVKSKKSSPGEYLKRFEDIKVKQDTAYSVSDDVILTLSANSIEDYMDCPLRYKFMHILKIPVAKHFAFIYGSAVHNTINYYHTRKIQGKKVKFEELEDVFKANWISEGFLSQDHEKQLYTEGLEVLKKFFDKSEKEKDIPTCVEKEFAFSVDNIKVKGRWDRVDIGKNSAVITDYKTSRIKNKKEADKRAKDSFQLAVYALSYQKIYNKPADKVQLYFLTDEIAGEAVKSQNDINDTVEKIKQASKGIRKGIFTANPNYMNCMYCSYKNLCNEKNSEQ